MEHHLAGKVKRLAWAEPKQTERLTLDAVEANPPPDQRCGELVLVDAAGTIVGRRKLG